MAGETPNLRSIDNEGTDCRDILQQIDPEDTEKKKKQKKKEQGERKKIWNSLGLDIGTVMMMGKAALPPTISIAIYQADNVAQRYTTIGYLIAVVSILGFCIMPRAKFVQTMTMNILSTCFGSAVALLMVWSAVKAREHTTVFGAPSQKYNSSQSAVLGVWLFLQIYVVNTLKAKFSQLALPAILYSIQVSVAATSGFLLTTPNQCKTFIQRLLESFLTGLAIATGVSLFVIPVTCRKVVVKEMTEHIRLLKEAIRAHKDYIHSLEGSDMFSQAFIPKAEPGDATNKKKNSEPKPAIAAVKKITAALQELHSKLTTDLTFAKREIAYGKLTPGDLEAMFKHLRSILLPTLGLGSVMDLFKRAAEINHWNGEESEENLRTRQKEVAEFNELFQFVHDPINLVMQVMVEGLTHIMLKLQLQKLATTEKSQNQNDLEGRGDRIKPGDKDFAYYMSNQADMFLSSKESALRHWIESKGIKPRAGYFSCPDAINDGKLKQPSSISEGNGSQQQLHVVLYVVFLLDAVNRSILEFVKFADGHQQATAKRRFINPGGRRLKKWFRSIMTSQYSYLDDEMTIASFDKTSTIVHMGAAHKSVKDPEHLPPENVWQKFGDSVRAMSRFFRSSESAFGFRAACATMSIGIVAFLCDTQTFFNEQRLVWAMIMVAISMTPTAGQSIFQFILRIAGTAVAMCVAWLIWYIPNQRTGGIITLLWFFVAFGFYIPLKCLNLIIVGMISVVTTTMIIGYELQVQKIGVQASTATGQPAYPIYQLGPYRLATVVGGLAVAFFWTIFPYPITEHSALRQKLGSALYLSAKFYSIVNEQVMSCTRDEGGNEENNKESPSFLLNKACNKVFAEQMLTLQALKTHSSFLKYGFLLGGRFPSKDYENIIRYLSSIVNYTAILGYASQALTDRTLNTETTNEGASYPTTFPPQASLQRIHDLKFAIEESNVTSHETTTLLSLLSSSIQNAQPLPPHIKVPQIHQESWNLDAVDSRTFALHHIVKSEYAAFAVMAMSSRCISMDIEELLKAVKALVGELDFSFHVVSTHPSSQTPLETLDKNSSRRNRPA